MKRLLAPQALVAVAFGTLLGAGCKDKASETTESDTMATAAPALPPAAAAPVAAAPIVDATKLPTEEDFEEEANRTITAQNVEAELDRLEKEISGS